MTQENIASILMDHFKCPAEQARQAEELVVAFLRATQGEKVAALAAMAPLPVLPDKAPETYKGKAESGDPLEFLRRVWGQYLDAGVLFRFNLGVLDAKLLKALDNHFTGRRGDLAKILPRKKEEVTRKYETLLGRPLKEGERQQVSKASSSLRFNLQKRGP